jgi:tRNA(fMet)-specific endonuclease VapC
MNFLLDTSIVLAYVRGGAAARRLESELDLLSGQHNLVVSVVSVGEIRSIAKQNQWGVNKRQKLQEVLRNFLIADIHQEDIIERYAEIDAFSQGRLAGKPLASSARNMGKNDLWIAATASIFDLRLLTTDKDFDHLAGDFLDLRFISLSPYG